MNKTTKRLKNAGIGIAVLAALFFWYRISWYKGMLTDVLHGVIAMVKVRNQVIQEIYSGTIPNSNAEARLPAPGSFKADGVKAIYVAKGATITILFDDSILGGGHYFEYIPSLSSSNIYWRCVTSIPARYLEKLNLGCTHIEYATPSPPPAMAGAG